MIPLRSFFVPLLLLLSGSFALSAQDPPPAPADTYALAIPDEAERKLDQLAAYLLAGEPSESVRLRRIFTWITQRIRYDEGRKFVLGERSNQYDVFRTLRTRQAICLGYSRLLLALCEKAELECEEISGYSKAKPGIPPSMNGPDHVWNAVRIDGEWQLVDLTWAAAIAAEPEDFPYRDLEYYYCAPPARFLLDHLPADPLWQLVDCPRSPEQFLQNPTDTSQLFADAPCWAWSDTLAHYRSRAEEDRRIEGLQRSYRYLPIPANGAQLGHAYMDRFVRLSEVSDRLQNTAPMDSLIPLQERMIENAQLAQEYIELYDWQKENLAYTHLNYSVALSFQLADGTAPRKEKATLQLMEQNLLTARDLLQAVPLNTLAENGLERCEEYLTVVRGYLKEYLNE